MATDSPGPFGEAKIDGDRLGSGDRRAVPRFHRHRWTKWEAIVLAVERVHLMTGATSTGQVDAQEKRCLVCGKAKRRKIGA